MVRMACKASDPIMCGDQRPWSQRLAARRAAAEPQDLGIHPLSGPKVCFHQGRLVNQSTVTLCVCAIPRADRRTGQMGKIIWGRAYPPTIRLASELQVDAKNIL